MSANYGELTGAALQSAKFAMLEEMTEQEPAPENTYKAFQHRLGRGQEVLLDWAEVEDWPDLPGELMDTTDFTIRFDGLSAAAIQAGIQRRKHIAWQKDMIAYAVVQIGKALGMAKASEVLYGVRTEFAGETAIIDAVDAVWMKKFTAARNQVALKVSNHAAHMRQVLSHRELNAYSAAARKELNELCKELGIDGTDQAAIFDRENRACHQAISAHIEATRQEALKAFQTVIMHSPTDVHNTEAVFSPRRFATLKAQGWRLVNKSSQIGVQ